MRDIAEQICERLTMREVAEQYGFTPNRAGFIHCPVHNEKTPSCKIFDGSRGWHCFGCGAGGSVIDFVEQLFNISFRQACVRLDNDFGLRLTADKPDDDELKRLRRERAQKRAAAAQFEALVLSKVKLHQHYIDVLRTQQPASDEDITPAFLEALRELPYLEYWLDEMRGRSSLTS